MKCIKCNTHYSNFYFILWKGIKEPENKECKFCNIKTSISIIIPTYNRKEVLRSVLLSLLNQKVDDIQFFPHKYEIIIVDDGSSDGTEDLVKQIQQIYSSKNKELRYFRKERGIDREACKVRNLGAKEAKYKFLLFLDQDEICHQTMLFDMMQAWKSNSYFVGINMLIPLDSYKKINDNILLTDTQKIENIHPHPLRKFTTISNIGLIEKSVFEKVGMFDEKFIGYGLHDGDLQLRLEKNGIYKVQSNARAYHIEHETTKVCQSARDTFDYNRIIGKHSDNISFIIPIKNQIKFASLCIESVLKYRNNNPIVIIDDNSDEETKNKLLEYKKLKNVELIFNSERWGQKCNKGLSYNWNESIARSHTPFVMLLNSDTILTKNSINEMLEVIKSDNKLGVVGPTTSYCSGKQQIKDYFPIRFSIFEEKGIDGIENFGDQVYEAFKNDKIKYMDVVGFCMLIRNQIFHINKIWFDSYFNGPGNEVDWQYRIKKIGWKCAWAKRAYVHHFGRISFDGEYGKVEAQKLWNEGGIKLKEKYGDILRMEQ